MDICGGCALAALACKELVSARWRTPRSHVAPELPVLSNQPTSSRLRDQSIHGFVRRGMRYCLTLMAIFLSDLAALVGDIHSAGLYVEHRIKHALAQ